MSSRRVSPGDTLPLPMKAALRAAAGIRGTVSPNPKVGAALVDPSGRIHTGRHARFGGPHAERDLLDKVGTLAEGGHLFVTLEPCCVHGKTPPCVDHIARARISRVTVAALDPDPAAKGKGIEALARNGIEVEVGVGAREALELDPAYYWTRVFGRAWIELKVAISLDGRTATRSGESQWITGPDARASVHRQRARVDAVVVGSGTARRDDPLLNVRGVRGPSPSRIVIDSRLRTRPESRMWEAWKSELREPAPANEPQRGNWIRRSSGRYQRRARLVLATVRAHDQRRVARYLDRGWEVWELPVRDGHVSLPALASRLGSEGFNHVWVEPGPRLAEAFLRAELVDALSVYVAPIVLGGPRSWTGGFAVERLAQARRFEVTEMGRIGVDARWMLRRAGRMEEIERHVHGTRGGNG